MASTRLQRRQNSDPDLILMEIQLPSMDGYDQSTKFLFAINHQAARARYRRAARRTFDR